MVMYFLCLLVSSARVFFFFLFPAMSHRLVCWLTIVRLDMVIHCWRVLYIYLLISCLPALSRCLPPHHFLDLPYSALLSAGDMCSIESDRLLRGISGLRGWVTADISLDTDALLLHAGPSWPQMCMCASRG